MIAGEAYVLLHLSLLILLPLASAVAGLLGGHAIGVHQTTSIIRDRDHSADEYHWREIAQLLGASDEIHDLAHQVIRASHERLSEFRRQLSRLQARQV